MTAKAIHKTIAALRIVENGIDTEDLDIKVVADWLKTELPNLGEIVVSWHPSTAVMTTMSLFYEYWDDFCYPSSDDVTIAPFSLEWVLSYHHWQQFTWGTSNEVQIAI